MKPILPFILLFFGLLGAQIGRGQGSITYISNLAQPSSGAVAVGKDSWIAALFFTGGNTGGYLLDSVQLNMADDSGSPGGFSVMIYAQGGSSIGIFPGSSLGTLSGSANPSTGGVYTFTAVPGLTLSSATPYFIVIAANTTVATGAYEWSLAGVNSYSSSDSWGVTGGVSSGVFRSSTGSSWTSLSATYPQFAINATAAPEPGTLGLLALGGLVAGLKRWNEKKRS